MVTTDAVLRVSGLTVTFRGQTGVWPRRSGGAVTALDDVSLDLRRHETLALVGESGSGKTTLGRVMLGVQPPTRGEVLLDDQPLAGLLHGDFVRTRRRLQVVFQDPGGSLTPWMTVQQAIAEPLLAHRIAPDRREAFRRVGELLELVGLRAAHAGRYPHEFSGGQRQRIAIARALALQPDVLVCDEVTSGLDASVRARVINLLADLHRERQLSYLFITHDLHVARVISDRIAVLRGGRVVELGDAEQVFRSPTHPYTRELLAAQPVLVSSEADTADVDAGVPPAVARQRGHHRADPIHHIDRTGQNKDERFRREP